MHIHLVRLYVYIVKANEYYFSENGYGNHKSTVGYRSNSCVAISYILYII